MACHGEAPQGLGRPSWGARPTKMLHLPAGIASRYPGEEGKWGDRQVCTLPTVSPTPRPQVLGCGADRETEAQRPRCCVRYTQQSSGLGDRARETVSAHPHGTQGACDQGQVGTSKQVDTGPRCLRCPPQPFSATPWSVRLWPHRRQLCGDCR